MKLGYARVSTTDQSLDLQIDALKKYGCDKCFEDKLSGKTTTRPGLDDLLSHLREGDTLVVWKLDRLGRSLPHLIKTVTELKDMGVEFVSLQESIDTSTAVGKLIFHIFCSLAEFERDLTRERVKAGLESARSRGRKGGRKEALSLDDQKKVIKLGLSNTMSVTDICEMFGITRPTYYSYVRKHQK